MHVIDIIPFLGGAGLVAYDGLDRLTSVSAPGLWGTATYKYDVLDNVLQSTLTGAAGGAVARDVVHNYDTTRNRLTSLSSTNAPSYNQSYSYDAQGNITTRSTQGYTFDQFISELTVCVFVAPCAQFSSEIFQLFADAESWIGRPGLTGVLTEYPVGNGVFDWAIATGKFLPKAGRQLDASVIGRFTTASMRHHHHYENGPRSGGDQ